MSPSRARTADAAEAPHPREAQQLFGHSEAEQELLQAYRSGRMPHAWLIGGPEGIGKATLAYRMARFVLAHPDPDAEAVKAAQSLTVPPDHSAARHIVAQAHSDLLVLERTVGDNGKLRTEIAVADVRRTISFFGSTAGAGGWRVCIVDSVDELNRFGTNALLKILEEPPAKSLLLLVSHVPGQVLPTIRSRCRRLLLRPLHPDDVVRAATTALGRAGEDNELRHAAALADGSVARALALFDGPTLALHDGVAALLARLPEIDPALCTSSGTVWVGPTTGPLKRSLRRSANGYRRGSRTKRTARALPASQWHGRHSTRSRPTSRFSISSANRWYFLRSICWPAFRAPKADSVHLGSKAPRLVLTVGWCTRLPDASSVDT